MTEIKTLAIIGLGQLGSSLVYDLKNNNLFDRVIAYNRSAEALEFFLKRSMLDYASQDAKEILQQADFVLLGLPINILKSFVKDHLIYFKSGSIVSDLSSTQGDLLSSLSALFKQQGCSFISSHPMAGTEKIGYKSGKENLFLKRKVFISPYNKDCLACKFIFKFWYSLGAIPLGVDPELHDKMLVYSSHILHLISAIITNINLTSNNPLQSFGCAGAFKDFTRITSSCPDMWTQIMQSNQKNILDGIDAFQKKLFELKEFIADNKWSDLYGYLAQAKKLNEQYRKNL